MTDKLHINTDHQTPEKDANASSPSQVIADNAQQQIAHTLKPEDRETLINSLKFIWRPKDEKDDLIKVRIKGFIDNPELTGAYIVSVWAKEKQYDHLSDFKGIAIANNILRADPTAKIIIAGILAYSFLEKQCGKTNERAAIKNNPRVKFLDCLSPITEMNSFTFGDRNQLSDEAKEGVKKLNQSYLGQILHCLEPYKIKDVRNPTADEQQHIDRAFEYTQKYFPGLDTKEKMLEYMMNVKLDLPEVMKGQRVEGVFCDVDGTLIEYAAAGSPDEGTQKLREEVVTLLKKYESEGKTITIWTGGNLEEKTTYLRSLGITRPIVSKYNYAGATAAIVIDDIGLEAFQMQSKITAETFIDAKLIK